MVIRCTWSRFYSLIFFRLYWVQVERCWHSFWLLERRFMLTVFVRNDTWRKDQIIDEVLATKWVELERVEFTRNILQNFPTFSHSIRWSSDVMVVNIAPSFVLCCAFSWCWKVQLFQVTVSRDQSWTRSFVRSFVRVFENPLVPIKFSAP